MSSAALSRSPSFGAAPCMLAIRRTREWSITKFRFWRGRCSGEWWSDSTGYYSEDIDYLDEQKASSTRLQRLTTNIILPCKHLSGAGTWSTIFSRAFNGREGRRQPFRTDLCNSPWDWRIPLRWPLRQSLLLRLSINAFPIKQKQRKVIGHPARISIGTVPKWRRPLCNHLQVIKWSV